MGGGVGGRELGSGLFSRDDGGIATCDAAESPVSVFEGGRGGGSSEKPPWPSLCRRGVGAGTPRLITFFFLARGFLAGRSSSQPRCHSDRHHCHYPAPGARGANGSQPVLCVENGVFSYICGVPGLQVVHKYLPALEASEGK